jgi:hypothetical protein
MEIERITRKAEAAWVGPTSIRRIRIKGALAFFVDLTYDLEGLAAGAGQQEKRKGLALGRQA